MKGQNIEELLNKRVKIITIDKEEFIGVVEGYVPEQDNEPEIEEIDILNEKDNRHYSLYENEIISIEKLE